MAPGFVQQRSGFIDRFRHVKRERQNGMNYDCLVIGLGGMGSSALYHLARRGLHVCGLEQFGPVHDQGSSHGRFRVFRKAYYEHPDYVPLLQAAEQHWRDLEVESGASLFHRIGVVLSGPAGGSVIAGTLQAASQHDLPVEQLDAAEARRRWPMLRFPEDHRVVLDIDAGILAVEDCVAQHLNRAQVMGAEACFFEPVRDVEIHQDSVTVVTDQATRTATSVVVAGGAWSSSLLAKRVPPMRILHKLQLWHSVNPDCLGVFANLPAFFFDTVQGAFYGMPSGPTEVKIARHTDGAPVADPSEPGDGAMIQEHEPCQQFARKYLCGISADPARISGCMYTMSPDGHFLVGQAVDSPGIVFAAGFSGHGFKFASVIGEALADLATTGRTELPIAFLRPERFQ